MEILVVNQADAARLLSMSECIEVMERTLLALARGEALQPLRTVFKLPDGNLLGLMPACVRGIGAAGAKIITVFPKNHGSEYDAHQGAVLLFEAEHGSLKAIVDATAITGIRTAAVSAVATGRLAGPAAGDLAILGAGTQARAHLEAMALVRKLRRVRVWSIYPEEAAEFAVRESKRTGLPIEAKKTARETVAGADLICTVTPAKEPILAGEWVASGAHINAVGSSTSDARELDTACVAKARLFADRLESVRNEAGDFLIPRQEKAIGDDHLVGEIGDVLAGKLAGRRSNDEITLFKSLGLAVEDLAAAHFIYEKALRQGAGTSVEFGGRHFAQT